MGSSVVLAKDLHACVSIRCSVGSTPAHINIELRMHTPLSLPLIEQRAAAAAAAADAADARCCNKPAAQRLGSFAMASKIVLMTLPYAKNALAPHISEEVR
eukprot:21475-Heterococcus_DN1.PRE.5